MSHSKKYPMKPDAWFIALSMLRGLTPREAGELIDMRPKRLYRLLEKWAGRNWVNFGSSVTHGWLTDAGRQHFTKLAEEYLT